VDSLAIRSTSITYLAYSSGSPSNGATTTKDMPKSMDSD